MHVYTWMLTRSIKAIPSRASFNASAGIAFVGEGELWRTCGQSEGRLWRGWRMEIAVLAGRLRERSDGVIATGNFGALVDVTFT